MDHLVVRMAVIPVRLIGNIDEPSGCLLTAGAYDFPVLGELMLSFADNSH